MRRTADGPPRDRREGRRLRALQLHEQGWSGRSIAEALGATGGAVSQWLKRAREGGREALRSHPPPGLLPKLTEARRAALPAGLAQGAEAHGFVGDVWTTRRNTMDDTQRESRTDDPGSASRPAPPSGAPTTIATQDGRTLAYLEVGDPHGPLVLHNHGGPSSRLEARLFADAAAKHRVRLICVDRPGMGQSSPQETRTYAGWADDLTTIADALGYHEFGVTGWSEGGPWALAAAAYIDPLRLRHVSSIAGGSYGTFGDDWAAKYHDKADALGGFLALHFEPGFHLMYETLDLTAEHFRGTYIKQVQKVLNDYDRQILLQPDVETAFSEASAECFAHGSEGLVRDAELLYRRWAFDVSTIERRVHMWQGLDDRMVPAPINKQVADRMPGAVWHPVPGAGHFVAVGAADEVFGIAAEELGSMDPKSKRDPP